MLSEMPISFKAKKGVGKEIPPTLMVQGGNCSAPSLVGATRQKFVKIMPKYPAVRNILALTVPTPQ